MSVLSISLILLVGILMFLVEFLVIPGISLAGIAGFLLLAGGVFCGYYFHGALTGSVILFAATAMMGLIFYVAFKYKTWQKLSLTAMVDGKVGILEENSLKVGDIGITVSKLSPIGNAFINDKVYEVRSEGNYINSKSKIKIKYIDGNKIIVETNN